MLKEIFGKLGSEKYLEYTKDFNNSGGYLLSLINDILDFSALEVNIKSLEKEEIDLKAPVNYCLRSIRHLSDEKLIISFLKAILRAIKKILINLLFNAIKFRPSD